MGLRLSQELAQIMFLHSMFLRVIICLHLMLMI